MSGAGALSPWYVLWPGMAALAAGMGIGRFVYTPILPEMMAAGVLSLRDAGWVAAANFAGYLLGAMAATMVTARPLQTTLARGALVATVVAAAAIAATDSVSVWMAVRFVAGVASAFVMIFVAAQVLERLLAIGAAPRMLWMFSGVAVGIVGSSLMTLAAQAAGVGWQGMWVVGALLAAALAVPAWAAVRREPVGGASPARPDVTSRSAAAARPDAGTPTPTPAPVAVSNPAPDPATRRLFLLAVVAYGLFAMGYVIHATYLPAMVRAAGYPSQAALWIWVLVGVAALPSMLFWGAVVRRFGERRAIGACYAVEGVTALTPLVTDSIYGAAIAAVGLGGCFMAATGIAVGYVRSLDPAGAARSIGVMTAAFGLGQIIGPVVAAYLAIGAGFGLPSLLAFIVLMAAAALMVPRPGHS
jgi:MFS family permease